MMMDILHQYPVWTPWNETISSSTMTPDIASEESQSRVPNFNLNQTESRRENLVKTMRDYSSLSLSHAVTPYEKASDRFAFRELSVTLFSDDVVYEKPYRPTSSDRFDEDRKCETTGWSVCPSSVPSFVDTSLAPPSVISNGRVDETHRDQINAGCYGHDIRQPDTPWLRSRSTSPGYRRPLLSPGPSQPRSDYFNIRKDNPVRPPRRVYKDYAPNKGRKITGSSFYKPDTSVNQWSMIQNGQPGFHIQSTPVFKQLCESSQELFEFSLQTGKFDFLKNLPFYKLEDFSMSWKVEIPNVGRANKATLTENNEKYKADQVEKSKNSDEIGCTLLTSAVIATDAINVNKHTAKEKNTRVNELHHFCGFCKTNGETQEFYQSHDLKDAYGRVICPTLRAFKCPRCDKTGDSAHTESYCPQNPSKNYQKHSQYITYKNGYTRYSHGLKYTG